MKVQIIDDIFVRRFGNADAPKLICLHGFADSSHMYVPLSETALSENFEVIAVDLPGFGASPRDPSVNLIEDYACAVAALASVVSPGEPVGIVGHSIASAIAIDMVIKLEVAPIGVFSIEGNLTEADATAMWNLGKDAKRVSAGDAGEAYKAVDVPTLYYWGIATTPARTREFIETNSIPNQQYEVESHWPTVSGSDVTANTIEEFFDNAT